MEYTGDKSVLCTTRPIVLKGDGRILQNKETRFAFKGITSDGDNPKTLTLDGSGLGENIISGLDDSEGGAISLRKKGTGRWILSANSSIRGDIDVQSGTLCVMARPRSYEWFRFTDMQVYTNTVTTKEGNVLYGDPPSSTFYMREMAFFDESGISQSIGLQCVEDWRNVQPGQFAYAKDPMKGSVSNWNKLFDDAGNSYASPDVGTAPNREDESSWFSLVFRMPENSNPVKTFDLEWNTSSAGAGALNHPADFKMEGSVDGLHWVEIFSTNNVVSPGSGKWLYDKTGNPAGSLTAAREDSEKRRHGFSFAQPAFDNDIMDQVGIVSVAAAGTLKSIGGSQTIKKFRLDMASGGGTVEGFAFAETGTLYLIGVDTDSGVNQWEKSFNPENCTGMTKLSGWTLYVNGSETSKHSVSVTADGKVRLFGLGLRVIIR
jgi:autotransporter-associated beta strand protein